MKINKRNPRHWLRLCAFGACTLIAAALRPFLVRRSRRVIFYGHRLAGNLLPIYEALRQNRELGLDAAFLTMDAVYHRLLRRAGKASVLVGTLKSIAWLASAEAVVSDHGLHAMGWLSRFCEPKFYDVWHGIPFKGFDPADFTVQRRYDEVWVASGLLKEIYVEKFGFSPTRVIPTGYARTDLLVRGNEDPVSIRHAIGLPTEGKIFLFAPTWQQDASSRSIYPFGIAREHFMDLLGRVADTHNATAVVRTHLSTLEGPTGHSNVVLAPFAVNPDTERLLLVADVLVCDWSSIAFDYLLLDRPTIFLDVDPPFRKGFSLDASYRFGALAGDGSALEQLLHRYLSDAGTYQAEHGGAANSIREKIYETYADGRSTARCVERLLADAL